MTIKLDSKIDKSKLAKKLAKNNILAPFLDRVLDTWDEPWRFDYTTKQHDDAWHPSGDCLPKVTELYVKATSEPSKDRKIAGSLRKSFMVGHYWHQLIQHLVVNELHFAEPSAIERRGVHWWGDVSSVAIDPVGERPFDLVQVKHSGPPNLQWAKPQPYHWVAGTGDFAPLETPRWRGVVDIKTMSSSQFAQERVPAWAANKYLCQLQIYMDLFDEEQGMILAVNKDAPHDFKEFTYTYDKELVDAIYEKWHFVSECIDEGVEPTEKDNERFVLPLEGR